MRLVSYSVTEGSPRLGVIRENRVYDVSGLGIALGRVLPDSMIGFLDMEEADQLAMETSLEYLDTHDALSWAIDQVHLWAPVPWPGKVLAVAGNYQEHLVETGGARVDKERVTPRFFIKPTTAVNNPGEPIILPRLSPTVDYEAELGVIIGAPGRYIPVENALSYVGGYTIFNDVSGRSLTISEGREPRPGDDFFDWLNGKWFDTFAVMGPYLTTPDEVSNPQDLQIRLWVNGKLRQEANTGQMIFTVAELISFISQFVTLLPGDVIATGTVAGVGASTGRYLEAGDEVVCHIEGLGELRNPVENEYPGM